MRRVAAACLVGSAIEFYDFMIYGTAAALVFPTVFFPQLSSTMASIASIGTFASAFVARPIGGAIFGYLGDRLGRKKTLIATLLMMAVATVSVGLVPRTATIGIAAPIILIVLRLVQGLAAGGEWAGSVLLSAEYAPDDKRGRYGMFTLLGGGLAAVLTSLTFLGVNVSIGESSSAFLQWGWRIPFLLSAVLIGIALYVRLRIDETPVFAEEQARNLVPRAPVAELLRLQRREIVLAGGSILSGMGFVYMAHTYLPLYAHAHLGYTRSFIWTVGALGGLASIAFVAVSAVLCDRVGRRRMMLMRLGSVCAVGGRGGPADRQRQAGAVRGGCHRHAGDRRYRLRAHRRLHPRAVPHPLPVQRIGFRGQSRRCVRRRAAAADRRDAAGRLRQLGDRSRCWPCLALASVGCTYLLPETKGHRARDARRPAVRPGLESASPSA